MRQTIATPILFAVAGIAFAVASSSVRQQDVMPSVDVFVHQTYFVVAHINLLGIGAVVCLFYAVLYYLSARIFHLPLYTSLCLSHFAITLLALIGLANLRYLGLGQGSPAGVSPLVGLLAVNSMALLLVSSFLFFGIIVLAVTIKLRHAQRSG